MAGVFLEAAADDEGMRLVPELGVNVDASDRIRPPLPASVSLRLDGPLGGSFSIERMDASSFRLRLDPRMSKEASVGALQTELVASIRNCPSAEARSLILFEHVPSELHADCPSCRLRLPRNLPRTARIVLSGVQVLEQSPITADGSHWFSVQVDPIETGTRVVVADTRDEREKSPFRESDVDLGTSIGRIRLRVVGLPMP